MRKLLASIVATVGLVLGGAGAAVPAMASSHAPAVTTASDTYMEDWHTANIIGEKGQVPGLVADLAGNLQASAAYYVGTVTSSGCWPFTCGNGANNYFDGHNVYEIFHPGTGRCWNVDSIVARFSTSCGTTHPYSLWVQTSAHNGQPWPWHGYANVGSTDAAGGSGRYADDMCSGCQIDLEPWTSSNANEQTMQQYS